MTDSILKSFDVWTAVQGVKSKGRVKSIDNISLEGIAKLRELILELAVRGKLVPQDEDDEPASMLLRKIKTEKEKLIAEGKIKKIKLKINCGEDGNLFSLPNGWMQVCLSEVFDVRDGTHDTPKYTLSGYPLITSKNLNSGKLDFTDVNFISEKDHFKIIERSKVDKEDVLFAMIGSIGNPVIVDTDQEFSIKNVALFKYYNRDLSSPKYLQLFLKHAASEMKSKALGGVQSFVSLGLLRDFKFPLPPLAEQHRIVAKVDELMALCDKLEAVQTTNLKTHQALVKTLLQTLTQATNADELHEAWQRLSPHFDTLFCTEDSIEQLKQTVLQLAVMGRLVKQQPTDEPATALLKRIKAEKEKLVKAGKLKKEKELPAIADDEIPFALPKGWVWCRMGEITNYGTAPKLETRNLTDETWLLELEDIEPITSRLIRKVRFKERKSLSTKNCFRKGDILYSKLRPYLDKVIVADEDGVCSSEILPLQMYQGMNAEYFRLRLKSPDFVAYANSKVYGMNLPRLGSDDGRKAIFPLPPLAEQQHIVAKVQQLQQQLSQLETRLQQSNIYAQQLLQTVLQQAFAEKGKVYEMEEEELSMVAEGEVCVR